jgi:hypothetical protein
MLFETFLRIITRYSIRHEKRKLYLRDTII